MQQLLALSRLVDRLNEQLGRIASWLVLIACLVSAGNAAIRYAFGLSSNAWLEIQWYMFAAMVLLAAAFSLRFFRFGGVQKMVLGGVATGFLLYVMSKVTDDLSKAELLQPTLAAWLPVVVGGLSGFVALLYLEDG